MPNTGNAFLPIFLTFSDAQNRPNKCNLNRVHEAVFGFKEAGSKLGVTTWVPKFVQSVLGIPIYLSVSTLGIYSFKIVLLIAEKRQNHNDYYWCALLLMDKLDAVSV